MKRILDRLALVSIATGIVLLVVGIPVAASYYDKHEATVDHVVSISLPPQGTPYARNGKPTQSVDARVITLSPTNTVVLRGPVTQTGVAKWQQEVLAKSRSLPAAATIYLVLDTPGGDVDAGLTFIDTVKALSQQVKTITLFSASMGFQFVQNFGERLITPNGTLMSHHAYIGGLEGEINGELNTRLDWIMRQIASLDAQAAKRMGISVPEYERKIQHEYWVNGQDAVNDKAADRTVLITCTADFDGTEEFTFNTIFGQIKVTFARCPVIRAPLAIDASGVRFESKQSATSYVDLMLNQQETYVKRYITNGKFKEIQPK